MRGNVITFYPKFLPSKRTSMIRAPIVLSPTRQAHATPEKKTPQKLANCRDGPALCAHSRHPKGGNDDDEGGGSKEGYGRKRKRWCV